MSPCLGAVLWGFSVARKAISKKKRFEIFKRDEFTCQYCGSFPPNVLLHLDHIIPVSKGGSNDEDNLITACEACNLGKSAIPLSSIPKGLKDRALEIAESEAQINGYADIAKNKADRLDHETWKIISILESDEDITDYDKARFRSIRNFLEILPYQEVVDAAQITTAKWSYFGYTQFKYFCGVCWRKYRGIQNG